MPAGKKKTLKAPPAKKGNGGNASRFLFFGKAVLIGIICFCIAAVIGGAVLLKPAPVPGPAEPLQGADYRLQSQILQQLMREMWNKDAPEISRFDFTDDEVRSLLRSADQCVQLMQLLRLGSAEIPPPRYFQPEYSEGWLKLTYPWQILPGWFFGGCLFVRGEFSLQKSDHAVSVAVRSVKIGPVPVPASWAERIAANVLEKQKAKESWQRFDFLIQTLYYEPEIRELVVIYRPAALRRQLPF